MSQDLYGAAVQKLLGHFSKNVSCNHLYIGVGTGYFLDKCEFPSGDIRIALFDLNQNCLDEAAKKIKRYNPETYICNALSKISLKIKQFDTISLNYR